VEHLLSLLLDDQDQDERQPNSIVSISLTYLPPRWTTTPPLDITQPLLSFIRLGKIESIALCGRLAIDWNREDGAVWSSLKTNQGLKSFTIEKERPHSKLIPKDLAPLVDALENGNTTLQTFLLPYLSLRRWPAKFTSRYNTLSH
jgi:hypothetical protein